MTTRITAVYENGLLRPTVPLPLAEGETVHLTVESPAVRPGPPNRDELIRRIKAAKTFQEWIAAADAAAALEPGDGYDLCEALNENRRRTGERLLFPPDQKGKSW
jgi:predicted DNA-binding antitoxin AbrB/MazE fold protein